MNITQLRAEQYAHNGRLHPYINDWKKNPYTYLKARFYMEASAILVYFLAKTSISPNAITFMFGVAGLLGGVLLAVPNTITIHLALLVFFSKGVLDWSDGHLARLTGKTSLTGGILDPYASYMGVLAFQVALGFYVAQKSRVMAFYYLTPVIPLLYALKANTFAGNFLFRECLNSSALGKIANGNSRVAKNAEKTGNGPALQRIINNLRGLLDDRARIIDCICLLVFIEMHTKIFCYLDCAAGIFF